MDRNIWIGQNFVRGYPNAADGYNIQRWRWTHIVSSETESKFRG